MKLFRNKNTEEMYISLTDSKANLMDFNGNIITCSTEDYEEVNTKPKKQEFHRSNCTNCSRRKWCQIGYNDGFKAQSEKWIPVSSGQLPPEGEDVFVTYQEKDNHNNRCISITSYKKRFFGNLSLGKSGFLHLSISIQTTKL
jgi:hypothetical protein